MRAPLGIALGIFVVIAGFSFREWLIQEEIHSLKLELRDQIQDGIRQTQSLERLAEFKKVQSINERYLEPVVLAASRQIIPGSAQKEILNWRRELNSLLTDQLYLRELALTDKLVKDIESLRSSEKPGLARVQNVLQMTEALDSTAERTKFVKAEIEAISEATKKADQESLDKLKTVGKESLALLRKKVKKLEGNALANYLSSLGYEKEIEEPVLTIVFGIKHPQLRKKAWDEFNTQRRKIFGDRFKSIAKAATPKTEESTGATVAEVLKREYEREVQREKLLSQPNELTPTNPSNSALAKDPEILELGQ